MSFTIKQQAWVELNDKYYAHSYPLYHAITEAMYQVRGLDGVKGLGQGMQSKARMYEGKVSQIFDVALVPNYIQSEEHFWASEKMAMIARADYDKVVAYVKSLEEARL